MSVIDFSALHIQLPRLEARAVRRLVISYNACHIKHIMRRSARRMFLE